MSRAASLEERLNTQAELIQSLEADLKAARLAHKPADDKAAEVERLTKELETKTQVIERLQARGPRADAYESAGGGPARV